MIEAGLDPFAEDPYGDRSPEAALEDEPEAGGTPPETGVITPRRASPHPARTS